MQMKKMKKILLLILLSSIILPSIFAITTNEDINSYEYLKLQIDQSIDFQVVKDLNYQISYFYITSNFFPKTYNNSQYINNYTTSNKDYKIIQEDSNYALRFSYDDNSIRERNSIENTFILESIKTNPQIKEEIRYPLKSITSENEKYLKFEALIDTNTAIKKKASELAYGEDDIYKIAVKIADWIQQDITYDLSTVTENPNQKSSQVFTSKTGVCKEITNLYVSMMRSLGIPARTISGYAYTNSPEVVEFVGNNWGGHAWSEVLIGDTWVPFDLTYSEYGYVDASHIILSKNENLQQNSISINASGYGITLVPNSLETKTEFKIIDKKEQIFGYGYQIAIEGNEKLSPESYGYIKINVKNTKDYYKVIDLRIAKTPEIELIGPNKKLIILKPNEEETFYFTYKIPKLDDKYIYTFPFTIYNNDFEENISLEVKKGYETLLENELPLEVIEEKTISNNELLFDCKAEYDMPKNIYSCNLKNQNNFDMNNINICLEDNCQIISLLLNEEKNIEFTTTDFNQTITIQYLNKTNTQNLSIKLPKIISKAKKNKNEITLNCEIQNPIENLGIEIILNNKTITDITLNEIEKIIYLKEKYNKIIVNLKFKNEIIHTQELIIEVDNKDLPKTGFQAIISKIIGWFESLFS